MNLVISQQKRFRWLARFHQSFGFLPLFLHRFFIWFAVTVWPLYGNSRLLRWWHPWPWESAWLDISHRLATQKLDTRSNKKSHVRYLEMKLWYLLQILVVTTLRNVKITASYTLLPILLVCLDFPLAQRVRIPLLPHRFLAFPVNRHESQPRWWTKGELWSDDVASS